MQSIIPYTLLSKNIKIEIHRTVILLVLCGCETLSFTLMEKRRLRAFENRLLRRKFGPKRGVEIGDNYITKSLLIFTTHQISFG